MTVTVDSVLRLGNFTTVTVSSDLGGTVYFHWYLDGSWLGGGTETERTIAMQTGDEGRLEVQDTTDEDYDPITNAPAGYPARRTIWWVRSADSDVERYLVEQQKDGGAWSTIGTVPHVDGQWSYQFLSPRLTDLSSYAWRVTPYDAALNAGTAVTLDTVKVVRTPDAPAFTATFNAGPTTVTLAAA